MTIALKVRADETVDSKLAGLERKGRVFSLLLENIPHIEFGVMAYFNSSSTEACVFRARNRGLCMKTVQQ